jgi:hypothetical protein
MSNIEDSVEEFWPFGVDEACFLIAAAAWPFERVENREEWAVRISHDAYLWEVTSRRARQRLESAIAATNPHRIQ